jgi:hypothetical protein
MGASAGGRIELGCLSSFDEKIILARQICVKPELFTDS